MLTSDQTKQKQLDREWSLHLKMKNHIKTCQVKNHMCDTKLVNSLSSLKKKINQLWRIKSGHFPTLILTQSTQQLHMESDYWKQRF